MVSNPVGVPPEGDKWKPSPAAQLAGQLEPELTDLGELVGDRHEDRRKGADVRWRRRGAIEEFDRDVRAIVRTAQGTFRLGGIW